MASRGVTRCNSVCVPLVTEEDVNEVTFRCTEVSGPGGAEAVSPDSKMVPLYFV